MKEGKKPPLKYPQKSHRVPKKDITGKQFGLLTVIGYDKDGKWFCRCKCEKIVSVKSNNLHYGNTTSCGICGNRKAAIDRTID